VQDKTYDVVIVGGGINGLCTAFHLHQRGSGKIALIEARHFGHEMGSSHGHSRITRSAYADPLYVQMMQYSHQVAWPILQQKLKQKLLYPCSGLFYGPQDGLFQKYVAAVTQCGANVSHLTKKQAEKEFPQFQFHTTDGILQDHTSAIIAAQKTMSSLADYCKHHIDVFEHTKLLELDNADTNLKLHCEGRILFTQKAVFCMGPWIGQRFPLLRSSQRVVHQNVYYLELQNPKLGQANNFPVWVELGMNLDENYYGLPEFGRSGIKVAKHHLTGSNQPEVISQPSSQQQREFLRRFQTRMRLPIKQITAWERCQYTVTANEDFILDQHPEDPRIVIGAGFSGHGFKFGPVTGQILADLVVNEESNVPGYTKTKFGFTCMPSHLK